MFKGFIAGIIAIAAFYLGTNRNTFDNIKREEAIVYSVKSVLEYMHYSPKQVNDEFSAGYFDEYIDNLDGLKRFLTMEDVKKMEKYKYKLDDQINNRQMDFFNLSYDLINNAYEKTRVIYKDILDTAFVFDGYEKLELDPKKRKRPANDKELRELWKRILKYEVMTRVINKMEEQEKNKDKEQKSFEQLESDARSRVKKIYDDMFKRIDKLRREDRFEIYINSFTNMFDPHTEYFSPKEKEDFDIRMGGKLEGIGARLQVKDDYTKIISIIPGGPAWKSKQLEAGDIILRVAQGDSDDFVDLTGMRIDDVVRYIRGKKGTKVRLEVKKTDGSIKIIEIIRDEVIIEETKAKSVVVGLENNIENIGYIKLPSFYSEFTRGGNNCADDIKKEIDKLKDKGVKGIILDLRYNGGGSLRDVIKIGGFFIKKGPMVQVRSGKEPTYIHKDRDAGVEYDGPLVIMVNELSASASEILAAAMQDYNRAVIVGSKATFGKGTVQRFYDLDNMIRGADDVKPLGNLKVTTQKFYRINGGSTQLKGVESDIVLPDNYMYIKIGEREYENAMPWDKINPVPYHQDVFQIKNKEEIIAKNKERITKDSIFILMEENARRLKQYSDSTLVTLNLQYFKKQKELREKKDEYYKNVLGKPVPGLKVENLNVDMPHINEDSTRIASNEEWLENIKKDKYIEESIKVVKDIITEKNKNDN